MKPMKGTPCLLYHPNMATHGSIDACVLIPLVLCTFNKAIDLMELSLFFFLVVAPYDTHLCCCGEAALIWFALQLYTLIVAHFLFLCCRAKRNSIPRTYLPMLHFAHSPSGGVRPFVAFLHMVANHHKLFNSHPLEATCTIICA